MSDNIPFCYSLYSKIEFGDMKPIYRMYECWAESADKTIKKGLEYILSDSFKDFNLRKTHPDKKPKRTERYTVTIVIPKDSDPERISKMLNNQYYSPPKSLLTKFKEGLYFGTVAACAGYVVGHEAGLLHSSALPFIGIVGALLVGFVFDKLYTDKKVSNWKDFLDNEVNIEYLDSETFREADS